MSDETKRPTNDADAIESLPAKEASAAAAAEVKGGIIVQGGTYPTASQLNAGIISPDRAAGIISPDRTP